jgi:hypothetical protein
VVAVSDYHEAAFNAEAQAQEALRRIDDHARYHDEHARSEEKHTRQHRRLYRLQVLILVTLAIAAVFYAVEAFT